MSDYYKILGVSKTATNDDIKKAYRKLAKKYHPDKNSGASTEEKFKEISEAYSVLGEPARRTEYDQFDKGAPNRAGSNIHDIFEGFGFDGMFDSFFGQSRNRRSPHGRNLLVDLHILFEEAAHGCVKILSIQHADPCVMCGSTGAEPGARPVECDACQGAGRVASRQGFFSVSIACNTCSGRGQVIKEKCNNCLGTGVTNVEESLDVNIPAGINSREKIRIPRKGEAGPAGRGDLLVMIHVEPHSHYHRVGADVHSICALNVAEAALGCQKTVSTVHGPKIVHFPPGTQPGHKLRLKDMGVPHLKKNKRGSHILDVSVSVPRALTIQQKDLFEKLKKTF